MTLLTFDLCVPPHQSAGELENDEHTAGVMMQMVRTASRFRLPGSAEPPFKRMSGNQHTPRLTQSAGHPLTWTHPWSFSLLSDSGGFRLHGDSFWSEGFCGQTSEQPAGTNQRLEMDTQEVRWWSGGLTQVRGQQLVHLQLGVRCASVK